MERNRNRLILNLAQAFVWACVLVLPAFVNWLVSGEKANAAMIFRGSLSMMLPLLVIYAANYLLLVPQLLFKKKLGWFIDMEKRDPSKPLPKFLFRMMGLVSRQKPRP